MPQYEFDTLLATRIQAIVKAFPDNFDHIDPKEILPIHVVDMETARKYAEVKKIPLWVQAASRYKIGLLVYEPLYDPLPEYVQDVVLIHELNHIIPHRTEPGEYALRDHDIQDFASMLGVIGIDWVKDMKGGRSFNVLGTGYSSWDDALKSVEARRRVGEGKRKKKKKIRLRRKRERRD